jgi:hypothetical protein
MDRKRLIVPVLLLLFYWMAPPDSRAQAISLPSIRTTGPSPEAVLLQRMITQVRRVYDEPTRTGQHEHAERVLNRLAIAGVSEHDIDVLGTDSISQARKDSILARYYPDEKDAGRLRAYQRSLASTRTSERSDDVDEYETGELIRQLRLRERDPEVVAQLDSLSRVARAVVIDRKLQTRHFFPVHSREQALVFWKQPGFSTLNIGFVAGTGGEGVAYTELASPFLHFVRISVNTVLAATEKEDAKTADVQDEPGPDEAAMMRFVNGGGLLNIAFSAPLYNRVFGGDKATVMVLAHPRFGGTLPALGASERDSTLVYDAGAELHVVSVDAVGGAGLSVMMRGGLAGGSGNFGQLLGAERNNFAYATLTAGLSLGNRYVINVGRTLMGPNALRSRGWQLGVTALRGPAGP